MRTYEEMEYEDTITEKQAARLVAWIVRHGHSESEAYEALAYVMSANVPDSKE